MESFDKMTERISNEISQVERAIASINSIWLANQNDEFKMLLRETNRANGALLGFLIRQRLEVEKFRDNPPPTF